MHTQGFCLFVLSFCFVSYLFVLLFMLRSNTFCDSYLESNGFFFPSSCFSINAFFFELYSAFWGGGINSSLSFWSFSNVWVGVWLDFGNSQSLHLPTLLFLCSLTSLFLCVQLQPLPRFQLHLTHSHTLSALIWILLRLAYTPVHGFSLLLVDWTQLLFS